MTEITRISHHTLVTVADNDFRIYENRRDNLPALSKVVATFSTFDSAADYLGALNNT